MSRSIVKRPTILEQFQALKRKHGLQELAYMLGCSESTARKWGETHNGRLRIPNLVYRRAIEELYQRLPKEGR